jgi:hypothetical protein|tara:strand:+ start:85 stop:1101 length:1017 start_codon:yes stop_codon:yes gene_type:complete
MQQTLSSSDTSSIDNSRKLIKEITTLTETHITNCQEYEKVDKLFLNIPLELVNILIPVLITILLFFIGFFINWVITKKARKRELESIKTTVTNWIDLIEKPIQNQVLYCKTFADNLKGSTELQPESLSLNQLHASKLKELNLKELIETFITNTKGTEPQKSKNLFNLISQIEYFSNVELMLPDAYKTYQEHTFVLMENWNKSIKELDEFKSSMVQQIGIKKTHPSYPFLVNMHNIFNSWVRNNPNGPSLNDTKSQLLEPLIKLADSTIIKNSSDPFAPILFTKVQDLIIVFNRKESHFAGNAKNFEAYVSNMNLAHETLKKTSNKFKEAKILYFWRIK